MLCQIINISLQEKVSFGLLKSACGNPNENILDIFLYTLPRDTFKGYCWVSYNLRNVYGRISHWQLGRPPQSFRLQNNKLLVEMKGIRHTNEKLWRKIKTGLSRQKRKLMTVRKQELHRVGSWALSY